jgi:anti-sigma regulatory factor (Ser/Thr protein kinase)
MSGETQNGTIHLEIPSDFRWLDVLNASLMAVAEEMQWNQDFTNEISIAAIEAASNAVEHGNSMDAAKRVCMRIRVSGGKFMLGVCDDGPGVDPSVLERPLPGPDDLSLRGRGFSIMKALMDDIRFLKSPDGRFLLELEKALPKPGEAE